MKKNSRVLNKFMQTKLHVRKFHIFEKQVNLKTFMNLKKVRESLKKIHGSLKTSPKKVKDLKKSS